MNRFVLTCCAAVAAVAIALAAALFWPTMNTNAQTHPSNAISQQIEIWLLSAPESPAQRSAEKTLAQQPLDAVLAQLLRLYPSANPGDDATLAYRLARYQLQNPAGLKPEVAQQLRQFIDQNAHLVWPDTLAERLWDSPHGRKFVSRNHTPGKEWVLMQFAHQLWRKLAQQAPAEVHARALLALRAQMNAEIFISAAQWRWHESLKPELRQIAAGADTSAAKSALWALQENGDAGHASAVAAGSTGGTLLHRLKAAQVALHGIAQRNADQQLATLRQVADLLAQPPGPKPEKWWQDDWVLKEQGDLALELLKTSRETLYPAHPGGWRRDVPDNSAARYKGDASGEKYYADAIVVARRWLDKELAARHASGASKKK